MIEATTLAEQINSKKNILLERKKYEVENAKLHTNLINKKEEQLQLETDIAAIKNEIDNKVNEIKE